MANPINTSAGSGNVNNNPNIDVNFSDPSYDPPCPPELRTENSLSIEFSGSGSTCDPLSANVIISHQNGNSLIILNDGLYISGSAEDVTSVFGRTGDIIANLNDYASFYYPLNTNPAGYISGVTGAMVSIALGFSSGTDKQVLYNNNGTVTGNDGFQFNQNLHGLIVNSINGGGNDVTIRDSFQANMSIAPTSASLPGGAFNSQGWTFLSSSALASAARWYNFPGSSSGMGPQRINKVVFEHSLSPSTGIYANMMTLASGDASLKDGTAIANIATFPGRLTVASTTTLSVLSGTGSRMVVASAAGVLSTQAIPSFQNFISGVTNPLLNTAGVLSLLISNAAGNRLQVLGDGLYDTSFISGVTSPLKVVGGLLSWDFSIANTWTGAQTFNTNAPTFGTMTSGSLLFAGTGGLLSQDNNNLFWDSTNKRLGIGTSTPANVLHVFQNANAASAMLFENSNTGILVYAGIQFKLGSGSSYIYFTPSNYTFAQVSNSIVIQNSNSGDIVLFNATETMRCKSNGRVLIGTTTDDGVNKLQVSGPITSTGMNVTGTAGALVNGIQFGLVISGPNVSSYNGTYTRNTSASGAALTIWENDRGSFASYIGFYAFGSTSSLGNLVLGISSAHDWNMFLSGGASNAGLGIGTFNNAPFILGSNNIERIRITGGGNILVATTTDDGINKLQVNGPLVSTQYKISSLNTAPATSSSTGTLGEIRITAGFIYVCSATNTWVRSALATF